MDRFKQGNVATESEDYDSQVTSRHQLSESYSSELDCSLDASSESNGKTAYIEQLKEQILKEQSKEKKKKQEANEETIVSENKEQIEQEDIIPRLMQD